jgi:hypothetical protein
VIVHPSVVARWWLYHLPGAAAAQRFLVDSVETRSVTLVALESLESEILSELAADLASYRDRIDDVILSALFIDVRRTLAALLSRDALVLNDGVDVAFPAFVVASSSKLAFADAQLLAMALARAEPLIVATDEVAERIRAAIPRGSVVDLRVLA